LAIKVTGPGGPSSGAPGAEPDADGTKGPGSPDAAGGVAGKATDKTEGLRKTEGGAGRTFAETLAAGRAPSSTGPAAAGSPDALTADIAADLKAGRLDAQQALDKVVERVIDQQLRHLGANAPAALREQLRDALRDTVSSDPMLAERLRSLG
jgi:hypothetical protein